MIRILHLSYCDKNSGAGIAANRIHNCICDQNELGIKSILRINTPGNHNSKTIGTKKSISIFFNFFKKYLERILIKIFKYDDNVFHSISVFPSLKHEEINNLDIDLVHIHWVQHETISIEEIGKIKFPIVWTLHDCWPFSATEHYQKDNLDQRYIRGYKIKKLFKLSDYIDKLCFYRKKYSWENNINLIAPSKWIADCAKNSLLMKDRKITVIPNPINTKIFKPINKRSARESLKLKLNKKVILFGSIDGGEDPRKGADLLIDLLKFLTFKKKDIQIVIFGKKNKSQNIFKNTNFEIINLGKINSSNKMSIIYSAADVFIIPSRIESFGQTAAEAQSCGTPVAGFDIGGLKDIIKHGENGILIEPFNSKKLALALESLLKKEDKISKLSKASRKNALAKWDHRKVGKSHLDFYKNILGYG
ncbi:MAG: glycosyltransferase [Prochlorococcus marinus CUG1439]|uniref:glycosyltransferase n=1 Tax=Prochlorococcus sp. MIT 1314 TaxID=3096220 RepID=UPI001B1E944F|nr:glycosyltransferase [Prochlorococcus sp. MIT 1314]MCR8538758.1 glycosyltransferase [Prochlorococcus marinus CUG1439]